MTVPRYNICTIWSQGEKDPLSGIAAPGVARSYKCEVARGGKTKLADKTGAEFYPTTTFWARSNELIAGVHIEPQEGELIVKGEYTSADDPTTLGAEIIRGVMIHNNVKFGQEDSYTIGTNA